MVFGGTQRSGQFSWGSDGDPRLGPLFLAEEELHSPMQTLFQETETTFKTAGQLLSESLLSVTPIHSKVTKEPRVPECVQALV